MNNNKVSIKSKCCNHPASLTKGENLYYVCGNCGSRCEIIIVKRNLWIRCPSLIIQKNKKKYNRKQSKLELRKKLKED